MDLQQLFYDLIYTKVDLIAMRQDIDDKVYVKAKIEEVKDRIDKLINEVEKAREEELRKGGE